MHPAPRVLAAKRRHLPDHLARAAYWIDLETRLRDFQAKFATRTTRDFASCERRSADAAIGRVGYKPSTVRTWLREWHAGVAERRGAVSQEVS